MTHGLGPSLTFLLYCVVTGAGVDGVEEIKRHPFFVTIDWNVSRMWRPPLYTQGKEGAEGLRQLLSAHGFCLP